jgi:hypothetical protein
MESNLTVFEKLASSLPIEERKVLLSNINKSLKLYESSDDYIKKEIPRNELEARVRHDINKSSWFEKIILKFYTFFTGKNPVDFFLKRQLIHLKKRLNSMSGNPYFDHENRKLSGRLASEVYSLYVLAAPLSKLFKVIWHDTDFIESVYSSLVTDIIHTTKREIYDFISLEEMETIFESTGEKNQIRKKLINRMNEYLNSIPIKIISDINDNFLPFYYGKFFVLFPFKNFLNAFGCSVSDLVEFRSPEFKITEFSNVIDRLERLYYALTLFSLINWNDEFITKIAGTYLNVHEKIDRDLYEERLQYIRKEIKTLDAGIHDFIKKTPLEDIIKYIKNDSYYELICKIPKPDFFEFYSSTLKLRILSGFTEIFQDVQKKYISSSIERIFLGYKLYQLNGYREYNDFNHKELNLDYFKHISSLMLIHNFLTQYYKEKVLDVFQVLYKTVLSKNPNIQTKIASLMKEADKTIHEINHFDKSLLSDHEDGKTFSLLKNEIQKSPALFRKYKSFIIEKDLAAERLIFSGLELLSSIRRNLEVVMGSPSDQIRLQLSSVYPLVDRDRSLRQLMKILIADVSGLNALIKQNLEVEKN